MDYKQAIKELAKIDKELKDVEVEVRVRQNRLTELRPKYKEIEADVLKNYNCGIKDLPDLLKEKESEFIAIIESLQKDLVNE